MKPLDLAEELDPDLDPPEPKMLYPDPHRSYYLVDPPFIAEGCMSDNGLMTSYYCGMQLFTINLIPHQRELSVVFREPRNCPFSDACWRSENKNTDWPHIFVHAYFYF
jgi:hypothetical protein